mgnify:CR=1 FL=1
MNTIPFPVIDLAATGRNIQRLREERGLTVRDLQAYFWFRGATGHLQVAEGKKPSHSGQPVRSGCSAPSDSGRRSGAAKISYSFPRAAGRVPLLASFFPGTCRLSL